MKNTKKLMFMSLMVAYSLILYLIESTLPGLYFIAPGAKLGLSNIVSVTLLYVGGIQMAFSVLIVRIILSSIFGGGFSAFLYSIAGGIFSVLAMGLIKKLNLKDVTEIGVSVIGSISFNIGQLLVAALMINNISIFIYLPVLFYVSVATGVFVGYAAKFAIGKIDKIIQINLD